MNMKKWLAAAVACSGLMLAACGGQGNATADAGKDASAAASSPAARSMAVACEQRPVR